MFNKIYFKGSNNDFPINDKIKCYSCKLNFNDHFDCLKNLFVSIKKFENLFDKELMKKEAIYDFGVCYLINKKFLNEFKDIFLYNIYLNDKNLFLNCKQTFFDIFSDKKKYINIFDKENDLKIDSYLTNKNMNYFYPINFNIINDEIYNNLNDFSKFLNINIYAGLTNKVPLIINNQKILIKITGYGIFFLKIDKNNELIPEKLLAFNNYDIRESYFNDFKNNLMKLFLMK